ncbi:hypothetical protein [Nocardioides solisilvae]|uniref:hypothetical protein n=1 Tax=Nocardioides solisilvae TaxID=1542435 RepID=UPI000D749B84|nr:hypothetical protein [Nocardioides solisilvae]
MARAQLAALACAGLLIGGHEPLAGVVVHALGDEVGAEVRADLGSGAACWTAAARDFRARLDLVLSVGDRVGDPTAFRAGTVPPQLLEPRPAWLGCFG